METQRAPKRCLGGIVLIDFGAIDVIGGCPRELSIDPCRQLLDARARGGLGSYHLRSDSLDRLLRIGGHRCRQPKRQARNQVRSSEMHVIRVRYRFISAD